MNHEDNTITPADMLRGMQIALIQKYGTLEKIYSTPAKDIQAAGVEATPVDYSKDRDFYKKGIAKAVNTLGDIYYYKDQFEISVNYYDLAIEVTRQINNRLVLGSSLIEKGKPLVAQKKIKAAKIDLVGTAHRARRQQKSTHRKQT